MRTQFVPEKEYREWYANYYEPAMMAPGGNEREEMLRTAYIAMERDLWLLGCTGVLCAPATLGLRSVCVPFLWTCVRIPVCVSSRSSY